MNEQHYGSCTVCTVFASCFQNYAYVIFSFGKCLYRSLSSSSRCTGIPCWSHFIVWSSRWLLHWWSQSQKRRQCGARSGGIRRWTNGKFGLNMNGRCVMSAYSVQIVVFINISCIIHMKRAPRKMVMDPFSSLSQTTQFSRVKMPNAAVRST